MSYAATLRSAAHVLAPAEEFVLDSGEILPAIEIGYELLGPERAPVVLVLGGISAHSHVCSHDADASPGWWEDFTGIGRAIDARRFRVLGVDYLGGVGASSGPYSRSDWGAIAPELVSTRDQARALLLLLDALGIPRLHALIGASYGGMVGLHAAALSPERVERLFVMSAAHQSDPWTTGWRILQRRALDLGKEGRSREALKLARGIAMMTYRSREEFSNRFAGKPAQIVEELGSWLSAHGERFADQFSEQALRHLSLSLDLHQVDPREVQVPTTLMAVEQDALVPLEQMLELSASLPQLRRLVRLSSPFGHDAFLKEVQAVGSTLVQLLKEDAA